ncbi:MAG TPA: L-histidine N(alpha)-methyltransferase [Burkholderiales bacterium]
MGREPRAGRALELADRQFAADVLEGLSRPRKSLPPKYFYDAAGSRLFERICRLREYYPTRTELGITRRHLRDIARFAGEGCALIEYGSGEGVKTRLLISALRPSLYTPVDISGDALERAVARLAREFPWLRIVPVRGDFSRPLAMPALPRGARRVVYFPGSTIGNLTPDEALAFLERSRAQVGAGGAMIVGVDLKKDANLLHAAYNDAEGVTAAFNRNVLKRINRELGGDFDLRRFRHYAFYDPTAGRVEMHLVSAEPQVVTVAGRRFSFERGESIHTENSYKYSIGEFQALAARAGFAAAKVWTDARRWFSIHGLNSGSGS